MPHHSASNEGLIDGGKYARPGEVSLAHEGILFLDEALEFKQKLLQSLREPTESGKVTIVRAKKIIQYPASLKFPQKSGHIVKLLFVTPSVSQIDKDSGILIENVS